MMRLHYLGSVIALLVVTACDGRESQVMPISPTPVVPFSSSPTDPRIEPANWRGQATVVSRRGNSGCGWGIRVGEEREVLWRVTIVRQSIVLEEDMSNWPTDHIPFSGTLEGQEFNARYFQGDDYARWVCQFREAHLAGRFSADFLTFEAMETLVWGVPGQGTVVERRWVAWRM